MSAESSPRKWPGWLSPLVALVVVLLDQASKRWAVDALAGGDVTPVVPGYLVFSFVRNTGSAFGMFTGSAPTLAAIAVAVVVLLVYSIIKGNGRIGHPAVLGLLLGGVVGNLIDRVSLGYVVDFVELQWRGHSIWPVFNIADSAITVGAVILAFTMIRDRPDLPVESEVK
ncbi:MAG TPA: signal peptidase II [Armatimonadota bacterium]|mgnify:CR=1 FL=1|nr:signal peptidase II [Armatimonadota bacterium]